MNPQEMRALIERYIAACNQMDIDEMMLTLHPDVEFRNISGGAVNASASGAAELSALARQSLALFSERHQEVLTFEVHGAPGPWPLSRFAPSLRATSPMD